MHPALHVPVMAKYRVFIDKDRCIDCGIETGHCPTHARELARLLANNRVTRGLNAVTAIIPEALYSRVKQAAAKCPMHAITVEKLDDAPP